VGSTPNNKWRPSWHCHLSRAGADRDRSRPVSLFTAATIEPRITGRSRFENFDVIRLIAAASVIFSHAFLISDGNDKKEPFVQLTGNILGIYGVFVFLIISGFLVTNSLNTSISLQHFAWKRFLRIFPALCVCALVSALLIGPFFSELGVREYVSSWLGPKYIAKVMLLFDVIKIPTVQFYANDEKGLCFIINGSLWTIASEVYCYIILFLFAVVGLVSLPLALLGLIIGSAMLEISLSRQFLGNQVALNLLYTLPSFCAGVAMYFIHARFGLSRNIALSCLVGLGLIAPTGQLIILFPLLAAYPLTYLSLSNSIRLGKATKFGDLSYGTYLYGWPVEQIVRSVVGTSLSGWAFFLISFPLAASCGWLSWHLVEKHALALKKWGLARRPPRLP
jgi:peptidoglycan/LPS O-acetylase OafA/YrhL